MALLASIVLESLASHSSVARPRTERRKAGPVTSLCLQTHPWFWMCFCQLHRTRSSQVCPCLETWLGGPCGHCTPREFISAVINLDSNHMVSQSHNTKLNSWSSALRNRASSNFSSLNPVPFLGRAQAYLSYRYLGSCFPSSQNPMPLSSPATSCSKMAPNDTWLCPNSNFCHEDEEWSTMPKALCLCRTRALSFDCLVFLLGWETEICPCLFCFLLLGGCSIIQLSLPKRSSAGLLLAQASYCCSAMKSEVPQTSRGPFGTSSFVFQWPAAAP